LNTTGIANKKEYEYKRLYRIEEQDPSSWQPLDTIRTFEHYQAMYGFGMALPQRLSITEGSDDYRIRNTRYRQFEDDQKMWTRQVDNLNTDSECFGFAKYLHTSDAGSTEWRHAIMDRPETGLDGKRRCKTWFIHTLGSSAATAAVANAMPGQAIKDDLDLDDVLLAPANPRILVSSNSEHQVYLAKAQTMRDAEGLKEGEIAARLNAEMRSKYANALPADPYDTSAPEAITVADVQHALKRDETVVSAQAMPRRLSMVMMPDGSGSPPASGR